MGEDLLCDPDPCLTYTFFQVPTLDRVQGRDLVIAGTKVDTCHRVLAGPGGGLPYETDGDARRKF